MSSHATCYRYVKILNSFRIYLRILLSPPTRTLGTRTALTDVTRARWEREALPTSNTVRDADLAFSSRFANTKRKEWMDGWMVG